MILLARDRIKYAIYSALYNMPSPVRPSTRVDQPKTAEVRIMQLSPQSSHMTLVSFLVVNFTAKFQKAHRERGRRMTEGCEKYAIFK